MVTRLGLVAAVAALAAAQTVAPITLNFQVEPLQENCFYEDVQSGWEVDANALVYRGGKLDVKLRIEGPDGLAKYERLLFSNIDDATGTMLDTIVRKGYKFIAERSGVYAFCVDNRMARWTAKVVTLEIGISNPRAASPDAPVAPLPEGATAAETAAHTVATLKAAAARLHSKMLTIENHQFYMFHREQRHRDTVESTNERVKWWSVVEGIVVLVLTAGQVALIHIWVNRGVDRKRGGGLPRSASGV